MEAKGILGWRRLKVLQKRSIHFSKGDNWICPLLMNVMMISNCVNVSIDLDWFLRWAIWSMGLLLVMQTLRGVKRNYVGPLKKNHIDMIIRPNESFICLKGFIMIFLICLTDLPICKNELLLCPNKEIFFFIRPLYAAVTSTCIHISFLIWHYIDHRKWVHKKEIRQECWHKWKWLKN